MVDASKQGSRVTTSTESETTVDERRHPRLPTAYITHGGGPCFFMRWDPPYEWDELQAALEAIGPGLPAAPQAILLITAHWEAREIRVASGDRPHLIYDYGGFPPHTYELRYDAPGSPAVAQRVSDLLSSANIENRLDPEHGWDHGVFIPLKVMYPDAQIPVVAMSLHRGLDPATHLAIGEALTPLRDEGVFIIGSGSSFHHFAHFGSPKAQVFDNWLNDTMQAPDEIRRRKLVEWEKAPAARIAHGREEHLLPLHVAAGAATDAPARVAWRGVVMNTPMSCFLFD